MKELQFPLIKVTLFFLFGILFSYNFHPSFWSVFIALIISFSFSLIFYLTSIKSLFTKTYFGITILSTSFFIGAITLICNNETKNPNHYINVIKSSTEKLSSEVVVLEKLKNTAKNDRYVTEIYRVENRESTGKIILNIRKDEATPNIAIGSHLQVNGSFYKNRNPNNPNQFDYGKYLENKQIYAQIYADAKAIKISSKVDKNLKSYASKIRTKIIEKLRKNNFSASELSIVNALVLGQQQDISKDVVRDYQYAGAVHILAVSGLHVGIILLFITFLLRPLSNSKSNRIIKLIITIILLCSYGILAGLSASITRSVVMFVFVAIGRHLKRSVNIYNTLLVSILMILLFKPSFLFDVGFQLSYTALFFIVWLQPVLVSIWSPKNNFVRNYFWTPLTVSFAAQIGTLPICIYYFHQTSLLFFITNLIILPVIGLILGFGIVVMLFAASNFVWQPALKLLELSIWLLNKIVHYIASFENFVIKDIPVTFYIMASMFFLFITWTIWFKKPSFYKLTIAFISIILFQIAIFQANYSNEKANEFIVFSKSRISIITERTGTEVSVYSNDSILKNIEDNLAIKSYLIANFCKINQKKSVSNLYYFKGKKILVIDSSAVYLNDKRPDILILRNSPKISLERVFKSWKPEIVVFDASNYKSYVKIWKKTCAKEKIPFHATAEKGFYKL